jgi:hypothetical protein
MSGFYGYTMNPIILPKLNGRAVREEKMPDNKNSVKTWSK